MADNYKAAIHSLAGSAISANLFSEYQSVPSIVIRGIGGNYPNRKLSGGARALRVRIFGGYGAGETLLSTTDVVVNVNVYGLVNGFVQPGVPWGSEIKINGFYTWQSSTISYSAPGIIFDGSCQTNAGIDKCDQLIPSFGGICTPLNTGASGVYQAQGEANYSVSLEWLGDPDVMTGYTARMDNENATIKVFDAPLTRGPVGCNWPLISASTPGTGTAILRFYVGAPDGDYPRIAVPPSTTEQPDPDPDPNKPGGGRPSTIGGVPVIGGGTPTIVPATPDTILLQVIPDPISFADTVVGNFVTQTFVVKNLSSIPITVNSIVSNSVLPIPDQAFAVDVQMPFTLEPNETKLATMYFIPKATTAYQDIFTINIQNPDEEAVQQSIPAYQFSVDGSGISGPTPPEPIVKSISLQGDVVSSGNINYNDVTVNGLIPFQDRILRIINSGSQVPLRIESLVLSGDVGEFTIIQNPIPAEGISLGVGLSWDVRIRFQPTSIGTKSAVVTIKSDADTGNVDEFGFSFADLTGRGVALEPLLKKIAFISNGGTDPAGSGNGIPINFGTDIKLNTTKSEPFRIKNIGNTPVTISGLRLQYTPPQTVPPFTLGLSGLGGASGPDPNGLYVLSEALTLEVNQESNDVFINFTPVTVTEFSGFISVRLPDLAFLAQSPTPVQGFSGKGKLDVITPEEPGGGGGEPEPEIPPDEVFDGVPPEDNPGETPGDGYSSACVTRTCSIPYLYKYTVNQNQPIT